MYTGVWYERDEGVATFKSITHQVLRFYIIGNATEKTLIPRNCDQADSTNIFTGNDLNLSPSWCHSIDMALGDHTFMYTV